MAKFRNYLKLRGAYLDHTTFEWDTTYHSILYRADVSLHSSVSTTDTNEIGSVSDDITSQQLPAVYFLYPLVPEEKYVLDGVADGNVVLVSDNSGGYGARLDKLTITIQRITEEGVVDDLASYSLGHTVSSGGVGIIVNGGSVDAGWTYAFPFWLEISAQEVSSDERLRFEILCWVRAGCSTCTNVMSYKATANSDDLYVNLPIV